MLLLQHQVKGSIKVEGAVRRRVAKIVNANWLYIERDAYISASWRHVRGRCSRGGIDEEERRWQTKGKGV